MFKEKSTIEKMASEETDFINDNLLQAFNPVQQDVTAPAYINDIWQFDFNADIPPLVPLVKFNNTPFVFDYGLSAIIAPEGTAKSYLVEMLIETFLSKQATGFEFTKDVQHLYYFDGERPRPMFYDRLKRCIIRSGIYSNPNNATLYDLSAIDPPNKLDYVMNYDYEENSLIILDGIGDLSYDVNNGEQSSKLVWDLLTMLKRKKCAMVTTLHVNPNTNKARGHLGSDLQRRANIVLFMNRIDTDVIEIVTKKSNEQHTKTLISWCNESHCFVHTPALELGAITYDKVRTILEETKDKNIEICDYEITSGELAKIFMNEFKVKERRANDFIKECKSKGIIYQTTNSKQAPYKLKLDFGSAF